MSMHAQAPRPVDLRASGGSASEGRICVRTADLRANGGSASQQKERRNKGGDSQRWQEVAHRYLPDVQQP